VVGLSQNLDGHIRISAPPDILNLGEIF